MRPKDVDKIVLDTNREVNRVRSSLVKIHAGLLEEESIYEVVIDSVMYESHAEFALAETIYHEWSGGCSDHHEAKELCDSLEAFGLTVIEQLKNIGAYYQGASNYRFAGIIGADIMLYSNPYYIENVNIPREKGYDCASK